MPILWDSARVEVLPCSAASGPPELGQEAASPPS